MARVNPLPWNEYQYIKDRLEIFSPKNQPPVTFKLPVGNKVAMFLEVTDTDLAEVIMMNCYESDVELIPGLKIDSINMKPDHLITLNDHLDRLQAYIDHERRRLE